MNSKITANTYCNPVFIANDSNFHQAILRNSIVNLSTFESLDCGVTKRVDIFRSFGDDIAIQRRANSRIDDFRFYRVIDASYRACDT